jgi:hypothetical protein
LEPISPRELQQIKRAVQLELPVVIGKPIPILYLEMDGTGISVVKQETLGRKGKTAGQPAHTNALSTLAPREVKLGCAFTQAECDEEGFAIRDPDSTTYVGAIETVEEFAKRLYLEAWDRGWDRAERKSSSAMALSSSCANGPEWIWNLAGQHFLGAIQIADPYHAHQHLWELARKLHPTAQELKAHYD